MYIIRKEFVMKKFISAVLLISMLASLAACGGESGTQNDTTKSESGETTAAPVDTDHDSKGFLLD